MMETKLWTALCALLLVNLGSADHGKDHLAPGVKRATDAPLVNTMPQLILHTGHPAPAPNDSDTNSRPNGTRVDTTSQTSEPKKKNATSIVSPSAPVPVNNTNLTQTQILPSENNTTSPHILTSTTTTTTTTVGPPHTGHIIPVNMTNNTSSSTTPLPSDTISLSEQPRLQSSTSVPSTSEPPKPETTTKTTTSTQHSSTSSTTSSPQTSGVVSQTLLSTNTSQSSGSKTQSKYTVATPSSASTHAQADTPSQLNVGGGTSMVHESPTLDPLLAGLVSAFIITAVIITLLLFLKLRRRDNRPEFRRLQDLPMDDMMEDTPLSMYSY